VTFVDPGAQDLINRLAARVAALEHQMEAVLGRLDLETAIERDDGGGTSSDADEVVALLRQGREVDAISAHRSRTGAGLREAKQEIDRLKAEHRL